MVQLITDGSENRLMGQGTRRIVEEGGASI